AAILETVRETVVETKAIRFEGNNYSEEWVKEAEKRGLPNLKKTPEALAQLVTEKSKKLLTSMGIFTEAEVVSRYHVRLERYVNSLFIEVETLRSMVDTMVLPACYAYHGMLAQTVVSAKAAGVAAPQAETLSRMSTLVANLQSERTSLEALFHKAEAM